jgi:DNA mismatch endonuclease, patch repair protein
VNDMDFLTPERRSWNMSRITGRNTTPEQSLRRILHRLGFRFRLETGMKMFGKPDIVLPKYRTVVFMHGCFWHRHRGCKYCYLPKTRVDFWTHKFATTEVRDRRVARTLRRAGWRVVVVWECQLNDTDSLKKQLAKVRRAYEQRSTK